MTSIRELETKAKYFRTGLEWRRWLEKYHAVEKEVWLLHHKKNSSRSSISHDGAVEEALCFGWIDGILKKIDDEKYVLRYTPRQPGSVWSKINKEKAERLIESGRMMAAVLSKIEEARRNGLWEKAYTSKSGEEMPADLDEALLKNPEARANFQCFANSYRNMYIGWVNTAKTGQTREKRIAEVVNRSAQNRKPGMA